MQVLQQKPTIGWRRGNLAPKNYLPFREEREALTLIRQYLPYLEFGITLVYSVQLGICHSVVECVR